MSLVVTGARFSFGRRLILDDLDLTAKRGKVLGLLGPNGSGKSTLLRCICRVLRPAAGSFTLDGTDIHALGARELARVVAYVPQGTTNPFAIGVAEAVMLGRTPHIGFRPSRRDWDKVDQAIEMLDLGVLAGRPMTELSGGQAQRVLIARALAQDGAVLLLDEPTSALDLRHQIESLELVRRVVAQSDVVAVMAIHDLNLAARFCNELAVIHDGGTLAQGPPTEVLNRELIRRVYGVDVEISVHGGVPELRPLVAG